MNKHGQAARFAYSPELVVAFFEALPKPDGFKDDIQGRIIRRWRTAQGVTRPAMLRMLQCYAVPLQHFEVWCKATKRDPVLRDKDNRRNR